MVTVSECYPTNIPHAATVFESGPIAKRSDGWRDSNSTPESKHIAKAGVSHWPLKS